MKTAAERLLPLILLILFTPVSSHAQGGMARKAITELVEAFTKSGGKNFTEELAEIGGERSVRELIEKAASQGGDDLVRQVVAIGKSDGPRALKAMEGDPALMATALRSLPEGKITDAVVEASRQPELMAKLVRAHGDEVLTASSRHPGIGAQVIDEYGTGGLKAARELGTDDVLILARAKGFRELPNAAQRKFIGLLDRDPRAVTNLLRLAGGGTAIVLTADFVNKLEDEIFGKDGRPGRLTQTMVTYGWIAGGILSAALAAYFAIKVLGVWRRRKVNP